MVEGVVEHGHMVGGGARSGVTATEHSGECFAGGIEVGQQWVEPCLLYTSDAADE